MNKITGSLMVAISTMVAVQAQAQSLQFTGGVVTNNSSNVVLYLYGPTAYSNRVCQVERLNPYYQTWENQGTVTLSSNGYGSFTASLYNGSYGFYRARTTNGFYYSINAFGAVVGNVPAGYAMIGNPFGAQYVGQIIPQPLEDTTVRKWNNAYGRYDTVTYTFGAWDGAMVVGLGEGVIVQSPTNAPQRFVFSGLFDTSTSSITIPAGSSIICTPLYQVIQSGTWQVDTLNTNRLGGYSALPVQTPGNNPQCTIHRMIDTSGNYQQYTLPSTNSNWFSNWQVTTVPLNLAEGFWINKPTNATWNVSRSIW